MARVLKAKYFPHTNALESWRGSSPSYTWSNIYLAKEIMDEGTIWKVGNGMNILRFGRTDGSQMIVHFH